MPVPGHLHEARAPGPMGHVGFPFLQAPSLYCGSPGSRPGVGWGVLCACSVRGGEAPWRHMDLPTPPRTPPYTHTHTHTHTRMHTQHTRMHTCPSSVLHVDLPTPPRTPLTHAHAACPSFLCLVVLHSDWRGRANSCGRDSPTLQLHPGLFSVLGGGGLLGLSLSLLRVLAWLSGRESLKARERGLFRRWFLWPWRSLPPKSSWGVAGGVCGGGAPG